MQISMPNCKYCNKIFYKDRDTKLFCGSTCRSLFRYHKKVSVQEKPLSVQEEPVSVTEEPIIELNYESDKRTEDWNPEKDI